MGSFIESDRRKRLRKQGVHMKETGEHFLKEQILKTRVAVIGDVMTDRYISGSVRRISPEAPVPVNLVTGERFVLGGAANTAANLASLGCTVYVMGMIGRDGDGKILTDLLQKAGIDDRGILCKEDYHTTAKIRILGARQQMLRLDFEEKKAPDAEDCRAVMKRLEQLFGEGLSCVVISDYGKGMITEELSQEIIQAAKNRGIPVLVDPKGSDWRKYDGAYGITPNLKELSDCLGQEVPNEDRAVAEAGRKVREEFHLTHLFVTRSEKGITAVSENSVIHRASEAQDVFDVSGAGDTVMAVAAAATAASVDMETLLELANCAAGIAVSKVGTYQVKREEVLEAWMGRGALRMEYRPLSWEEAAEKVRRWKEAGEKVVFTNGCFDILHRGHITYLQQAASLGDHLIIGLNSDASVRRLKGEERPVNNESDRSFMLAALRCVDEVVLFGEDTPEELLRVLQPDILVKGGDYKPEEVAGRQYAGRVEILPFVDGYSTTHMIERIRDGKKYES